MVWTNAKTWTAALVTVADLNTHIRDNLNYLKGRADSLLTNKSGSNLSAGAVVIFDGANNGAFTITATERDRRVIGVLAADTNNDADGPVDVWGNRPIQIEGTVARGEALVSSGTTAGKATGTGSYTWVEGVIAFALEGGTDTVIDALLVLRPQTSQSPTAGYITAGHDGAVTPETEEYDPDTWTGKTNIPSPIRSSHSFRGAGPLFAMGGSDGSALSDNDEYDPDTWTSRTSLLATAAQLSGGGVGAYGGDIGLHRSDTTTFDRYDVAGDGWSNVGVATYSRKSTNSGVADGFMYWWGGYTSTATYLNYTERYDYAGSLIVTTTAPANIGYAHGGAIDNAVCISIGGSPAASTYVDYCYTFDPATWTTKTASGQNRANHAAFDVGSMYYIAYGTSSVTPTYVTTCQEYDYSGDTYATKATPPTPTRINSAGGSI